MKEESTISKINSELIRTFASLDAWFDKVLDDGLDAQDEWNTHDVIRHIVTSNHHFLDLLSDGYDYAFSEYYRSTSDTHQSLDSMRFALREQLFQCLCLLDKLEHDRDDLDAKVMNTYDKLSSLTNHLHYHLEHLERTERVNW